MKAWSVRASHSRTVESERVPVKTGMMADVPVTKSAMSGLQFFGLQQPPHPMPIGAAARIGWRTGKHWVKPAEPRLPHPSRQKLEADMMKPQVLRGTAAFVAVFTRDANLGHTFF